MYLSFGIIDGINAYDTDQYFGDAVGFFDATEFNFAMAYPNVFSDYNYNRVYLQTQDKLFIVKFNWNNQNYNGEAYNDTRSVIPSKITISDNNGEIYNRNLYNLTNFSNRYTATAEIPNFKLNNQTLHTTSLLSHNNNIMVAKQIDLTKNVYEEMFINYITQFNITNDENDTNNIEAASRLVNSMLTNDFNNTFIGKYKINYDDNTSTIKGLSYKDLVYTDLSTTYTITIYVDKKIKNIQLISNDEDTTYYSINCENLEIGKYYKISQDLRLE